MCPDRQILSIYFDGELPSPWKEKMEAHLTVCPECSTRLEQYRGCSEFLRNAGTGQSAGAVLVEAAARDRVWLHVTQMPGVSWGQRRGHKLWRRTVSIPLPVVAAAAAMILIAIVLGLTRQPVQPPDTMVTTGMGLEVQDMLPVSDYQGVFQYLEDQDTADIVIIRLPETRSFRSSGEPTILKAADYSRRNAPR